MTLQISEQIIYTESEVCTVCGLVEQIHSHEQLDVRQVICELAPVVWRSQTPNDKLPVTFLFDGVTQFHTNLDPSRRSIRNCKSWRYWRGHDHAKPSDTQADIQNLCGTSLLVLPSLYRPSEHDAFCMAVYKPCPQPPLTPSPRALAPPVTILSSQLRRQRRPSFRHKCYT